MATTPRVTVWNEFRHERTDEKIRSIYPEGMHAVIARALREAGAPHNCEGGGRA
jgi:trehalose utilization protein